MNAQIVWTFVCIWANVFQILSMIEEAAGTRMYEEKRRQAVRCIEQKEAKLVELNTVRTSINCKN